MPFVTMIFKKIVVFFKTSHSAKKPSIFWRENRFFVTEECKKKCADFFKNPVTALFLYQSLQILQDFTIKENEEFC